MVVIQLRTACFPKVFQKRDKVRRSDFYDLSTPSMHRMASVHSLGYVLLFINIERKLEFAWSNVYTFLRASRYKLVHTDLIQTGQLGRPL